MSLAENIYNAINEESRKLIEGKKFYSYEPPDKETREIMLAAIQAEIDHFRSHRGKR